MTVWLVALLVLNGVVLLDSVTTTFGLNLVTTDLVVESGSSVSFTGECSNNLATSCIGTQLLQITSDSPVFTCNIDITGLAIDNPSGIGLNIISSVLTNTCVTGVFNSADFTDGTGLNIDVSVSNNVFTNCAMTSNIMNTNNPIAASSIQGIILLSSAITFNSVNILVDINTAINTIPVVGIDISVNIPFISFVTIDVNINGGGISTTGIRFGNVIIQSELIVDCDITGSIDGVGIDFTGITTVIGTLAAYGTVNGPPGFGVILRELAANTVSINNVTIVGTTNFDSGNIGVLVSQTIDVLGELYLFGTGDTGVQFDSEPTIQAEYLEISGSTDTGFGLYLGPGTISVQNGVIIGQDNGAGIAVGLDFVIFSFVPSETCGITIGSITTASPSILIFGQPDIDLNTCTLHFTAEVEVNGDFATSGSGAVIFDELCSVPSGELLLTHSGSTTASSGLNISNTITINDISYLCGVVTSGSFISLNDVEATCDTNGILNLFGNSIQFQELNGASNGNLINVEISMNFVIYISDNVSIIN